MWKEIPHLAPINVLVDRSHDATPHPTIVSLQPEAVFRVTDNHRRLTRRVLGDYDVVVITGHGTRTYTKAERSALREFVERGGSLILAASAGQFEWYTDLPVERLATDALAREFGFAFLTAADLPMREGGVRGLARAHLVTTPAAKGLGLERDQIRLWCPTPIETPRGAVVLLKDRNTGAPVFARARCGKGTVLVCGDSVPFQTQWTSFWAEALIAFAAPRRRPDRPAPPRLRDVPRETKKSWIFTVQHTPATAARVDRVLEILHDVWREVRKEVQPPKMPKRAALRLVPGSSMHHRHGPSSDVELALGADQHDAGVAANLIRHLVGRFLWGWWNVRRMGPFLVSAQHYLTVRILMRLGYEREAERHRAIHAGRRCPDLGTLYSQTRLEERVGRFFFDLDEEFGPGSLKKLCRVLPKEKPFSGFEPALFSALDEMAWHLARALGEGVYDWLEKEGHTLRRIPVEKPKSDALKAAMKRLHTRILLDSGQPASDRVGAAFALAKELADLDAAALARKARAKGKAVALPAALLLSRRRDERGEAALLRLRDDPVAALFAVSEAGRRAAATALVRAARKADTRFKLLAGHALSGIGDGRAEEFDFANLPGCGMRRVTNGVRRNYTVVDGQDIAVVTTGPMWWYRARGRACSMHYVYWVHTSSKWRRLGIARHGFAAAEKSPWTRACSTTGLHAFAPYIAHSLYRDFGLVDSGRYDAFEKRTGKPRRRPPQGVRIRPAEPADEPAYSSLLREVHADRPHPARMTAGFPEENAAWVATRDGAVVGAVSFWISTERSELWDLAVRAPEEKKGDGEKKPKKRKGEDPRLATGLALLAAAERGLNDRGIETIYCHTWWGFDDEFHRRLLMRAGFAGKPHGLVEMTRLNDPVGFLGEIAGLFAARLAGKKKWKAWRGAFSFEGESIRAGLEVAGGEVRAVARSAKPTVRLIADDETIQRVLLGMAGAVEEHLDLRLTILPALNAEIRELLETLFPRPW